MAWRRRFGREKVGVLGRLLREVDFWIFVCYCGSAVLSRHEAKFSTMPLEVVSLVILEQLQEVSSLHADFGRTCDDCLL